MLSLSVKISFSRYLSFHISALRFLPLLVPDHTPFPRTFVISPGSHHPNVHFQPHSARIQLSEFSDRILLSSRSLVWPQALPSSPAHRISQASPGPSLLDTTFWIHLIHRSNPSPALQPHVICHTVSCEPSGPQSTLH